jgi:hypothetical protein
LGRGDLDGEPLLTISAYLSFSSGRVASSAGRIYRRRVDENDRLLMFLLELAGESTCAFY